MSAKARGGFHVGRPFWLGALGLVGFGLLWEFVARMQWLNKLFFPTLTQVGIDAWQMYSSGDILDHLLYTLGNFCLGSIIGIGLGVPLGLVLGWNRKLLELVDPVLSIALATPVIVLVPLVIATFGIYWQSKVAITAWSVFFPVLVAGIAGVQAMDSGLVRVARSFRASDVKIVRAIVLPGSLPTLVGGLRLGLARGLIGVLAAEFFGAPRGLGFLAFNYGTTFQPSKMFVAVFTMAIISILLTVIMQAVQRHFDSWRTDR